MMAERDAARSLVDRYIDSYAQASKERDEACARLAEAEKAAGELWIALRWSEAQLADAGIRSKIVSGAVQEHAAYAPSEEGKR